MVGKGVLLECLDHQSIEEVRVINRRPIEVKSPKIKEYLHADFSDFSGLQMSFTDIDACFFCLGVSSVGQSEADYTKITYDIAMDIAKSLSAANPEAIFCFVSGAGTDPNGRAMWARVKGKTEQDIQKLPFKKVVCFRPGFIQPLRGIRSATSWYNTLYAVLKPVIFLVKAIFPRAATNTTNVGLAMIASLTFDDHPTYLENHDINQLAAKISQSENNN
jgi:hypothetical protein